MDAAIDKKNEKIFAKNAKYGIYFCIECGELSFLRKPKNKSPHFYHIKYNVNCSLSVKSNDETLFINSIIEDAYNILQKNYSERWVEAIDSLIESDCLFRLYGKEWAINPINLYINKHVENIDEAIFYEFLHIISGTNNLRAFKLLLDYTNFTLLRQEYKETIEETIYRNYLHSEEIFNFILDGKELDIYQKFKLYCHMPNSYRKIMIKTDDYKIFCDIDYLLDKNCIERYKYFNKKYKSDILFNKMLLYKINSIRNSPENKLFRSINGIKNNYYDDLLEYLDNTNKKQNGT